MKIALVDDEEYQLNILRDAILSALSELDQKADLTDSFTDVNSFFASFEKGRYDIIVLDIFMGEHTGIDAARKIRALDSEVCIAFCTSSNEFASETYEVNASYYLNKPISREKVLAMLSRFDLAVLERNRSVELPNGLQVPVRQIMYTEYNNHKVRFHINGAGERSFYMTQGEAESLLLEYKGFSLVNKGCIVNFAQAASLSRNTFVMKNGDTVTVARRRFKEIENEYMRYRFELLDSEVSD